MTDRYHREALPPDLRPDASFRALSARLRRLEAALDRSLATPAWPAVAPATTSPTAAALWTLPDLGAPDRVLTVVVAGSLADPAAVAYVILQDADGNTLTQAQVTASQPITLTAARPAVGPYTIAGTTDTGTLTVAMLAATSARYIADDIAVG